MDCSNPIFFNISSTFNLLISSLEESFITYSKIFNKLRKLQLPLEFKKKKSNFIIKNNFKIISVRKSVRILKGKILNI